jgi:energy-coupling factor transporter ATP-binding protein EcfA2
VKHEPQDGRIEWKPDAAPSSRMLRTSFLPSIHGENLVVRFPEATTGLLDLESLGMPASVHGTIRRLLAAQEGTVLLTGPSGSGKTTTLYAMLRHLHQVHGARRHFLTIENPVERDLGFATQVQVNEAQGMTFEKALRAGLRHDPNVLLIGEIRDAETARICVQPARRGTSCSRPCTPAARGACSRDCSLHGHRAVVGRIGGDWADRATTCSHALHAMSRRGHPATRRLARARVRALRLRRRARTHGAVRSRHRQRGDPPPRARGRSPSAIAAAVQRSMTGNLVEEGHRLVREGSISRAESSSYFLRRRRTHDDTTTLAAGVSHLD